MIIQSEAAAGHVVIAVVVEEIQDFQIIKILMETAPTTTKVVVVEGAAEVPTEVAVAEVVVVAVERLLI